MITRLLLLGATGDMTGRFLLPALAVLRSAGGPAGAVQVVGAGEQPWDDARFRDHVAERLAEHAPDVPATVRDALLADLRYRRVDLEDPASLAAALAAFGPAAAVGGAGAAGGPGDTPGPAGPPVEAVEAVAVYLALPPRWFEPTLRSLAAVGLPPGSRVAVEKPFGHDGRSAAALNALLADVVGGAPGAAFRVDHILGMPRVEELQRLRGPGGPLEPLWDGPHLERVDILWEEILGLGSRTDFYDRTGAVRDVLQNHLLQVLALVAMEPPATTSDADLHATKGDVLRALRVPTRDEVRRLTRRARYAAGTLVAPDGTSAGAVPGYAEAAGVDPARGTETHAELVLTVDTPRWAGTRFVLRTGKALGANRKGVGLHLRPGVTAPTVDPRDARVSDREVWIELDGPRGSAVDPGVQVNAPGELSAYGRVLEDVLTGGGRTSVSAEEAELAWRVVDPVLAGWADGVVPLAEYPAGSGGPERLGPAPSRPGERLPRVGGVP